MATALFSYFGRGNSAPVAEEKTAVRALPASWYTSKEMYELERRAIFSRKWLLITHSVRFTQPGDFLRFEVAGYQFVLCRDRDGKINGFHNICRHRAYPVVTEERGTAKIFACRYHGWSYGINGKLAKAPGYQELDGFDKSKNGLLPIHVHLDRNGFVWINLDGKAQPEVDWSNDYEGADTQSRLESFNFNNYQFDHSWEQEGNYNWKVSADNYNESYHSQTTHADNATTDPRSYNVNTQAGWIQYDGATTPEQKAAGVQMCATYFFPNASSNISPHFFFVQRILPLGPTRSVMSYEVYRNKTSSDKDFDQFDQIYKRMISEDKALCEASQRNLNAGVFVNGEMHPKLEKGPLFFQKSVRDTVTAHYKLEQQAKQEIWPARQTLPNTASVSKQDLEFCSGLACSPTQEGLAW